MGTTTEGEATADNLTIADSSHCGITLRSGTSSVGTVFFSDGTSGTDEYRGYVQYDHGGNFLKFATDATERIRIDSSGTLKLVSSTGIDFSGIQTNASGMTSETLDSYEEGTWTPTISGATFTSAEGLYTKIGRQVLVQFKVGNLNTSLSAADRAIEGLPFTAANVNQVGVGYIGDVSGVTYSSGYGNIYARINAQGNSLQLLQKKNDGSTHTTAPTLGTALALRGYAWYTV